MVWTPESVTSTSDWTQLEPFTGGFGTSRFGTPKDEFSIHERGFGDPITKWTDITFPSTTWTTVTG